MDSCQGLRYTVSVQKVQKIMLFGCQLVSILTRVRCCLTSTSATTRMHLTIFGNANIHLLDKTILGRNDYKKHVVLDASQIVCI